MCQPFANYYTDNRNDKQPLPFVSPYMEPPNTGSEPDKELTRRMSSLGLFVRKPELASAVVNPFQFITPVFFALF